MKGELVGIYPNPGPSERRNASLWMWWYVCLYVMIWIGRVMCEDHDQSVRSWVSMESNVGVEVRDEVDGMIGERVSGLMNRRTNGRSERRRERRNERRREKRREYERGNEIERMEESLLMDIVTWNVQRMNMKEHNRRRLRRVCERIQKEGWEVVLLSELKVDENGMVWMGENGREVCCDSRQKYGDCVAWEGFPEGGEVKGGGLEREWCW